MLNEIAREIKYQERKLLIQEIEIENLRIKGAKYKAFFFHKSDLAHKLEEQERKNILHYNFMTLEDMLNGNIISRQEYDFCEL